MRSCLQVHGDGVALGEGGGGLPLLLTELAAFSGGSIDKAWKLSDIIVALLFRSIRSHDGTSLLARCFLFAPPPPRMC